MEVALLAKASTKKDPDHLVVDALRRSFQHQSELRLLTSGKNTGLFKDRKTADRKAAIERCLAGPHPFLRLETKTEKKKPAEYVTITSHGVDFLLSRISPEQAADLLRESLRQEVERVAVLEQQWAGAINAHRKSSEGLQQLVVAFDQRVSSTLSLIEADVRAARERSADIRAKLDAALAGRKTDINPPPLDSRQSGCSEPSGGPSLLTPASEEDFTFMRQLTRQMVFAWKQVQDSASKEAIERALFNANVTRIGKRGETIGFVSRLHECSEAGIFPDDPVEVVVPGWQLHDDKGEYLLAKAIVKAIPS